MAKVTGTAGVDVLNGTIANDTINGLLGADTMIGGSGGDVFVVDIFSSTGINSKNGAGDVIVDSSGIDTVVGAFAGGAGLGDLKYIMQSGLENALFDWTATDCTVTGNSAKNIITVTDGDDTLYGLGGNDTLSAGDGDDTLDGGTGADTLNGGDGKNVYVIDNKADVVIDAIDDSADEPNMDTAEINANWVMNAGAEIEIVKLMGTKSLKVTGNEVDNSITGNSGTNTIDGGAGNDWIDGGGGRDKLYGGLGADTFYFDADYALNKKPVTIMDFNVGQGDILDISDVLTGYDDQISITDWVRISDKGNNSIVEIDADGGAGPLTFVQIATIYGVTGLTGETALLNSGNIIAEA